MTIEALPASHREVLCHTHSHPLPLAPHARDPSRIPTPLSHGLARRRERRRGGARDGGAAFGSRCEGDGVSGGTRDHIRALPSSFGSGCPSRRLFLRHRTCRSWTPKLRPASPDPKAQSPRPKPPSLQPSPPNPEAHTPNPNHESQTLEPETDDLTAKSFYHEP